LGLFGVTACGIGLDAMDAIQTVIDGNLGLAKLSPADPLKTEAVRSGQRLGGGGVDDLRRRRGGQDDWAYQHRQVGDKAFA